MSESKIILFKCAFCSKSQNEVKKMIRGPYSCICDECVELCGEILTGEAEEIAE